MGVPAGVVPKQIVVKKNEDLEVVANAADGAVHLQVLVKRLKAPVLPVCIDKLTVS